MKYLKTIAAVLAGMAFFQSCTMKTKADLIGINGVVYTVDSAFSVAEAFAVKDGTLREFTLKLGGLTDDERQIILDGCLINFNRVK